MQSEPSLVMIHGRHGGSRNPFLSRSMADMVGCGVNALVVMVITRQRDAGEP